MIHQICKTKFGFGQILSMSIKLITVAIFIHQAFQISDAATIKQDVQRSNKPPNDSVAQGSSIFGDIQPYVSSYDILGDANGAIDSSSLDTYVDPMKTAASHHHHKGTKGWMDIGAWTKKKGSFGWYADFPVGKGK